jgi:hypothetical protein
VTGTPPAAEFLDKTRESTDEPANLRSSQVGAGTLFR